ncbi:MAG TPA: hypothetical protein VGG03_04060 [Thermoanaerobaculia bacterium]|jgi:hypothetical protein
MTEMTWKSWAAWALAPLVLVALATAAATPREDVVHKGVDLWTTAAGVSATSFAADPLPADFFCPGSKPFTGTIRLRGVPLTAEPGAGLGTTDTIVRRLDDARFDRSGVARTRIQLVALSLASLEPVVTECGAYDVRVRLEGEQPTTTMKIARTSADGGTYEDSLSLRIKVLFIPVKGGATRAVSRRIDLGPAKIANWTFAPARRPARAVKVDTDGDRALDTLLPPPTSFAPDRAWDATDDECMEPHPSCHAAPGYSHMHCVVVYEPCDPPMHS